MLSRNIGIGEQVKFGILNTHPILNVGQTYEDLCTDEQGDYFVRTFQVLELLPHEIRNGRADEGYNRYEFKLVKIEPENKESKGFPAISNALGQHLANLANNS